MGANSKISWTDNTFNPVWGCTKVGPGCDNCYAESFDRRVGGDHWGPGKPRREFGDKHWNEPLKWNAKAEKAGVPAKVFCASFADVFDNEWPDYVRPRLWALIKATPWLRWILVTKRIGNAAKMLPDDWGNGYPNVWLLITVVNQEEAERDIPKLLDAPARIRGLSIEPQLGPVNLRSLDYKSGDQLPEGMNVNGERCIVDALEGRSTWPGSHYVSPTIKRRSIIHDGKLYQSSGEWRAIDWVITGAESGPGARPYNEAWARSLRDQCQAANVAFFYKQKIVGRQKIETPELDGQTWTQFPRTKEEI